MTNEEQSKEWSRSRFGSTLTSFPFLSSYSSFSPLSIPAISDLGTPLLNLLHAYLYQKMALGVMVACPGELELTQASYCFNLSNLACPGKLVTSALSYLGAQKNA